MLNLNVTGETIYLANMQIYTAFHQKYQNSSFSLGSLCAALLATSPHCALMLPASMSSNLAGNVGTSIWQQYRVSAMRLQQRRQQPSCRIIAAAVYVMSMTSVCVFQGVSPGVYLSL